LNVRRVVVAGQQPTAKERTSNASRIQQPTEAYDGAQLHFCIHRIVYVGPTSSSRSSLLLLDLIDLIASGAYTSIPKVAAAFVLCAEIPPTGRFYSSFVVSVRTKSACSLAYRQVRSVRSDKAKIKAACRVTLHTADKCCCKFGLRGTIRGR